MTFGGFFNNLLVVSGGIVVGGLLTFFIAVRVLKLLLRKSEQREGRGGDFDMAELFELHQQGKLSDEEYQRAKQVVLAREGRWGGDEKADGTKRGFAVMPPGEPQGGA